VIVTKQKSSDTPRSLEDEAAYWEDHSPVDEPENWVEVRRGKVGQNLAHVLAVRLDASTIDRIAAIARHKGLGPSTLARMWLLEELSRVEEQDKRQEKAS
jgi:hypothetical protein